VTNRKRSTKPKKIVMRAAPEAEYLTLDEAAIEMRCCRKSAENWILRGELRPIRLGRKVLVARQEIQRFMRNKTAK
jgi:excisionase family DNA binding protein